MEEKLLWRIGSLEGINEELVDNFKDPSMFERVVWNADDKTGKQKWPLFHPSEADPDSGYRLHPYTIRFTLAETLAFDCLLHIDYLVIFPRAAYLEAKINGEAAQVHIRPAPSESGEIKLHSGLHTTIYSEGRAELRIPASMLRQGENLLELISRDGGEYREINNIEVIRRLDRMANGAGILYQMISFFQLSAPASQAIGRVEVRPSILYRRDITGELFERCDIYLEVNQRIESADLRLTLASAGRSLCTIPLILPPGTFGHLHQICEAADGEDDIAYEVSGVVNSRPFYAADKVQRCRKWKVFAAPHAHTDIGYTHRQWEVAERLCRNIDKIISLLEEEEKTLTVSAGGYAQVPSKAYHLDAAWTLEHYRATRDTAQMSLLLKWVRAGRIGIASNYADLLSQFAGLEDTIRNSHFTDEVLRPEGLQTDFAAFVDVASLSGSLPDLLSGSGVKYVLHADNQDRGPFRLNGGMHRQSPFYWEGQAGGKVLYWLAKMYCELRKVCGSPPMVNSAERGLSMWLKEYEREDYAPDAVLLYGQEADNTDLDPQPLSFIRQWNETYAYPQLIASNVSDFFQYIEEHFKDGLPVCIGDGGAYWEDGAASSIVPSIQVREAQSMLPAAERLEALAVVHHPGWNYPQAQFAEAWKQVLLYDEHTWGAFLSCTDPDALLAHDQWREKEYMATSASVLAKRLLHSACTRHSLNWNNNGREVVVYNPHSWTVSGAVQVEIAYSEKLLDAQTGTEVVYRTLARKESQSMIELWVDALPGLSYRRFALKPGTAPKAESIPVRDAVIRLENAYYRLEVDTIKGCVVSCLDKIQGKELVDVQAQHGFGQFVYVQGGENTRIMYNQSAMPPAELAVDAQFELEQARIETYSYGKSLMLQGRVRQGSLQIVWTLYDEKKTIDLQFIYDKEETFHKEAVYVAFPLAMPRAEVSSDSQLGWVNWDKDELPGGCKEWLPLQTGIHVSEAGMDVLICSPDIPLFCVGDIVRGHWPKTMDLTGGKLYSYVLNNYWHTNYKAAQGGRIAFSYRLTSAAVITKAEAYRLGWEARQPLYAQRMSFQDFREPKPPYESESGGVLAEISPETVALTTIKQANGTDGFIIRLQEIAGRGETATIRIPQQPIVKAWSTNLLEEPAAEIPIGPDGSISVNVPAWGLATVKVLFAGEAKAKEWIGQ